MQTAMASQDYNYNVSVWKPSAPPSHHKELPPPKTTSASHTVAALHKLFAD
jgi:hypothetical protein